MTVDELKRLNNLSSNALSIGQVLRIKEPTDVPMESEDTYTVKAGDTLYGIAKFYGLSVDELKRLNNLTSNTLSIGQKLKIKETGDASESDEYYIVKSGDSLYKIANLFGITVDELKQANN